MKRISLAILTICLLFVACKKDENQTKIDESRKKWQSFKASVSNSYSYTVPFGSWTGSFLETTITVQNGKVIERAFKAGNQEQSSPNLIVTKSWTETGAEIGTHDDYAAKPITLDQIYAEAPSMINVSKEKNDIYFSVDDRGLISSVGYVPKGCQDDCFNGIHIKDIKAL
ncbi:hypothetical protein D0C36_01980 [Mucilaginibacter conchicola]|uniref:Uncharacterized protein n=1 Tax=Mucilaginibacter conchicola TaxID=2303333 RepID=A0A372NXF1_9SPHI|nr:hypothetical protein [Mucilaginibacter conchicola]RFZ94349.1 hypothetical protein D0C36_01980 [Mucilaginibacter conchicola]